MQAFGGPKPTWKGVKSVDEGRELIDIGVLLAWSDVRSLKRTFSVGEQVDILKHFARRLSERYEDRLAAELIVESLLIWTAANNSEQLIDGFIEAVFEEPDRLPLIRHFTEISLTCDTNEVKHYDEMFAVAVSIVSQLGINLKYMAKSYPEELAGHEKVLAHIGTYLSSVSNNNSSSIRFCLMNYFGVVSVVDGNIEPFNKLMGRFGHTALDTLFSLLFNKKSEAVALEFMLDNLPFVLMANDKSQQMLHEIFKFYMLKKPEKFSIFISVFSESLRNQAPTIHDAYKHKVTETYLKHLALLLKVVSEVNHKQLAKEILLSLVNFEGVEFKDQLITDILRSDDIRPFYRDILARLRDAPNKEKVIDSVSHFRSSKRGRKPSFSRSQNLGILSQINFLGAHDMLRAS